MKDNMQWLIDMLIPAMDGARQRRKFVESEWLLNYRAWQGWPSQSYMLQLPDNAIHYFIPHARRAVEKNVARATKLLMPNMDWHQTLPFDGHSHENAEAVHNVMRYVYQKKLPTKRNISSLLRCIELYNFAAVHTSVMIQRDEVWPYQRAVDPFSFYILPDTASCTEEALIIFEDSIVPYQVYKSFVNEDDSSTSIYEPIEVDDLHLPEWPYHLVERIAYRGLSTPSDFAHGVSTPARLTEQDIRSEFSKTSDLISKQSKAFVALSKVYFRIASNWYYAVICTNIKNSGASKHKAKVVRLDDTENQPLYRWTNTRPLPGELYTNSAMDDLRVLQNLANNALSQVESNRVMHAEPPFLVDSNAISRMDPKTFANRKVWFTDGNPNEVVKVLDIADTQANGLRALQIYLGLLDKGSGGGMAEGQPGRNMPRAGFAANTLLNVSLVDVEDLADTVEQDILSPSLGDVYHIILEYIPDSQLIKIPNRNPQLIKQYAKTDITGDYSFSWQGSLGFQDTQVRADKFMQFLQLILNPQLFPLLIQRLEQENMTLDIVNLVKTVYSFGLGERGLGDIIIPMTPQQIQQAQQNAQMQQQLQGVKLLHEQGKIQSTNMKTQAEMGKAQLELQGKAIDNKGKQMDNVIQILKAIGEGQK